MHRREEGPWQDPLGWTTYLRKRLALLLVLLFGVWALMPPPQRPGGKRPGLWPPQSYLVYYGGWDDQKIAQAQQFGLVIAHPGQGFENISAEQLRRLRLGQDRRPGTGDDVVVIGYLSLGEQPSPPGGPRRPAVDGAGPVYQESGGLQFSGGYPTYFLDELALEFSEGLPVIGFDGKPVSRLGHDGIPDENGVWGSFYVHPGDPGWRRQVRERAQELTQRGFDGFFLDTLDTAAPEGNYPYLSEPMFELVGQLRQAYPDRFLVANRGFFLLREHPQESAQMLDAVMFESLVTEWDWEASRATTHRWLEANHEVLQQLFAQRPGDLEPPLLLALDYLDPEQPEAAIFRHTRSQLLQDIPHLVATGHPWLDRIFKPEAQQFPDGGSPLPPAPLDIEIGPRNTVTVLAVDEPPVGAVYDLRHRQQTDGLPYHAWNTFSGSLDGLDPQQPLRLAARYVGDQRSSVGPWHEWRVRLHDIPGPPEGFQVEAGDGEVKLSWPEASRVELRYEALDQQPALETVATEQLLIETSELQLSLSNGRRYAFQLAYPGGAWTARLEVTPQSHQAPDAPTDLQVSVAGGRVDFRWPEGGREVTSYRLYCMRQDERWRLPLRPPAATRTAHLEGLLPGSYRAFITSVDGRGYESRPAVEKTFSVSAPAAARPTQRR